MTPCTLLESLGPKLPCTNLFHGNPMRRTYHFQHSLENVIFKNLWNLQFWLQNPSKWQFESFKIKKSPPAYVCHHRNRFTCRTTTPFVSAGTQGLKDVFQSKCWILKWFQKFFRELQLRPSRLLEGIFWCITCDFHENPWKSWKNRHLRTFEWIKMDWCGFWWHHALRWIP